MIKIPNRLQIQEWDKVTITRCSINSVELMERAAVAFVSWFAKYFPVCNVMAFCGRGNNGGDGLAVLRLLHQKGYAVSAIIIGKHEKETMDFRLNLERAKSLFPVKELSSFEGLDFSNQEIIIDALFGTGLNRKPEALFAKIIEVINSSGKKIVSVDIPSGLLTDSETPWPVVHAHHTVTFQVPKLSFLMPAGLNRTGNVETIDIGLDPDFENALDTSYFISGAEDFRTVFSPRQVNAHKGHFGHALVMAGSYGMIGAATLSVKAALKTGAGKITAAVPACGYGIMQTAVPEAMVHTDSADKILRELPDLNPYTAVAFGPGTGTARDTEKCLIRLLEKSVVPLVIDADGLNMIASDSAYRQLLSGKTILTPHPGEFRRLAGPWKDDFDRLRILKQFAAQTKSVVVLKGARTCIAFPDGQVFFNPTGHPFMATAGSGDVLTGIIVSLLAQGFDIRTSVLAGVFLHGKAGEIASGGTHPIIAGEIIAAIPVAWEKFYLR
ncbi:MAG: NAD(P)H-hydrate dehydratase [Cyclobacteriaceae bacterium]